MPSKNKNQFKYIWAMRKKYKSKKKAPKNMKWVFNKEWTDNISFRDLPNKVKENHIHDFINFINEKYLGNY